MRFEARELKPHAEPISAAELESGEIYFSVQFIDEQMRIPILEPWVFIGKNLMKGDRDTLYFQDIDSYRRGVQYETPDSGCDGVLKTCSSVKPIGFFDFERALELLMACSLRRNGGSMTGSTIGF